MQPKETQMRNSLENDARNKEKFAKWVEKLSRDDCKYRGQHIIEIDIENNSSGLIEISVLATENEKLWEGFRIENEIMSSPSNKQF